jgi:Sulfatase
VKPLEHPATTAFGATTILLLVLLVPLASPTHEELYHLSGPVSAILVPTLLNLFGIWLLLAILFHWGRRHPWLNAGLWSILSVVLPWRLLQTWVTLRGGFMPHDANLAFAALLVPASAVFAWRSRIPTRLLQPVKRFFVTLLGFSALGGLLLLAETLAFAWQARHLNAPRPLHLQTAVALPVAQQGHTIAPRGRIIWIVFDELSYRQVYEHRYPGLKLPAFDQLATEATVFTHTIPAGLYTSIVLSSLITGLPLDGVHAPARGWPLALHNTATHTWQQLDPHRTVFQDALDAGYGTAVAGWYIPYCRILPEVLDRCFWTNHMVLPGRMFPGQTIAWNSEQPVLRHLAAYAESMHLTPPYNATSNEIAFHQQDYSELLAAGDKLLDDPSLNFLLLHMPIPHPNGMYNRHTESFLTNHPSYLDNLALCDRYLAHVRQKLERLGAWDDTTLVLMGDHSWRVHLLWAQFPAWTPEEQIASEEAQFDDRPAYIVKLPHQTTPAQIELPFAALRTRELFDNLLTGRITTPQQLAKWAQQTTQTATGTHS